MQCRTPETVVILLTRWALLSLSWQLFGTDILRRFPEFPGATDTKMMCWGKLLHQPEMQNKTDDTDVYIDHLKIINTWSVQYFVMGRHKCEVIACLSSQTQCKLIVILCTEFMANKFDLITFITDAEPTLTWPRWSKVQKTNLHNDGNAEPLMLVPTTAAAAGGEVTTGFSWTASAANLSASSRSWRHFICTALAAEPWTLPYRRKSLARLSTSRQHLFQQTSHRGVTQPS